MDPARPVIVVLYRQEDFKCFVFSQWRCCWQPLFLPPILMASGPVWSTTSMPMVLPFGFHHRARRHGGQLSDGKIDGGRRTLADGDAGSGLTELEQITSKPRKRCLRKRRAIAWVYPNAELEDHGGPESRFERSSFRITDNPGVG